MRTRAHFLRIIVQKMRTLAHILRIDAHLGDPPLPTLSTHAQKMRIVAHFTIPPPQKN